MQNKKTSKIINILQRNEYMEYIAERLKKQQQQIFTILLTLGRAATESVWYFRNSKYTQTIMSLHLTKSKSHAIFGQLE